MNYKTIWATINGKLNDAINEDKRNPLLLIGGYRAGEVMRLDNSALFDEFMDGDPDYYAMDVDPQVDYNEQFEQFTDALRKGYRFGDYQQFATLQSRLETLRAEFERLETNDYNPARLWDSAELASACRVWINGGTVDLSDKLAQWNDAFAELLGYLEELDHLAWDNEE